MASLVVDVHRYPKNAGRVAGETSRLLHGILSQFDYTGKWYITLTSQLTKRVNFKFQVTGRRGVGIVCRTKPGDNGTCWEVIIEPPQGYLLDKVYTDLRMVPPDGKMRQTVVDRLETLASLPPTVVPSLVKVLNNDLFKAKPPEKLPMPVDYKKPGVDWNASYQKCFNQPIPQEELKRLPEPVSKTPPVPVPVVPPKFETQAIVPKKTTPEVIYVEKTTPEKPTEVIVPVNSPYLSIIKHKHENIERIGENNFSLNSGLIAVCMVVDPQDGSVQRHIATKALIQELELVEFVRQSDIYTDHTRVVAILLKNLVQKSYLARWGSSARKEQRVRETTKGYVLTPNGREQLAQLKNKMPFDIQNRLFKPGEYVFKEIEDVKPEQKIEAPAVQLDKIGNIQGMFAEFEKCKKAVQEWQDLETECETRQQTAQTEINAAGAKMDALNLEKAKLGKELDDLIQKKQKIDEEIQMTKMAKNEEVAALEKIKEQLQSVLK